MPPVGYRQHVIDAMPATPKDIRDKTVFAVRTITGLLRKLRDSGECHIGDWKRADGKGNIQPIYFAGPGQDKPCNIRKWSKSAVGKRCYRKLKGTEAADRKRAKDAAKYYAKKMAKTGDALALPMEFFKPSTGGCF